MGTARAALPRKVTGRACPHSLQERGDLQPRPRDGLALSGKVALQVVTYSSARGCSELPGNGIGIWEKTDEVSQRSGASLCHAAGPGFLLQDHSSSVLEPV